MASLTNKGIPLSSISPRYLHTISTSQTFFSAVAQLSDNAYDPDVSAKQFWIDKTVIKDQDCLIFMDNGKGMDYEKMRKMFSFGFSDKQTIRGHVPVGLYGNGFKSGSMRLGKDAIVFSKKANTMCVGLLSQTYLEKIKAQNVIVPIVMSIKTGQTVSAAPEHAECLRDILTHSLFNTKEELLNEFSVINRLSTNSSGTRIIIWNLRRRSSGELEVDFMKDPSDIRIPVDVYESTKETNKRQAGHGMSMPESEYSLRAYCSILYLKPRMQIILRGLKVEALFVTKTLAKVYRDTYKPACLKEGITITFGYNTKSKGHYGLMMYHKNRLIKAYERVACQRKANSTGVGVIGVIECNYLTPTHNKQDFENTDEYRKTMLSVSAKLEDYWKEVHYRHKKNCTEPFEDIVKKPDQNWVQCDDCLKWRRLPGGIDSKQLPKKWFCHMNPNPQFRSCTVEEEPEDSDDEQPGYQKTYKQHERNQKLQEEKNRQQMEEEQRTAALNEQDTALLRKEQDLMRQLRSSSPSTHRSSIQRAPSSTVNSSSLTGSSPSVNNSIITHFTAFPSTPTGKKRALSPSQENPEKKSARMRPLLDIQDIPSTSTALFEALCLPAMFIPYSEGNKGVGTDIKTEPKDSGDDEIDKSTVKKEQSNEFTQTSSEDLQNYKVLYLQVKEEIKQIQQKLREQEKEQEKLKGKVDSLKDEKCTLLTCWESLQKEVIKKKKVRSIRPRELRQRMVHLLANFVPALDLQQVNYNYEVINGLLTQVIDEISPTESASTYKHW